jgi:hypothetical protein
VYTTNQKITNCSSKKFLLIVEETQLCLSKNVVAGCSAAHIESRLFRRVRKKDLEFKANQGKVSNTYLKNKKKFQELSYAYNPSYLGGRYRRIMDQG